MLACNRKQPLDASSAVLCCTCEHLALALAMISSAAGASLTTSRQMFLSLAKMVQTI